MYLPLRPDLDTFEIESADIESVDVHIDIDPELPVPGGWQEVRHPEPEHEPEPDPEPEDDLDSASPLASAPLASPAPSPSRYRSAAQAQRTKPSRSHLTPTPNPTPTHTRTTPTHTHTPHTRTSLRAFADLTLAALEAGAYFPPGAEEPFDLGAKMRWTEGRVGYYAPWDERVGGWAGDLGFGFEEGEGEGEQGEAKAKAKERRETKIVMREISTLAAARELHKMLDAHPEVQNRTIGVLNFASAKKPGGGFMNGAQAQEESIARSSTLYPSLITPTATQFYAHYAQDPDNPYYTHAMVYSPGITLFRNDKGDFKTPIDVDVLTSAAVNAGEVRKKVMWEEEMRVLRARVRAAEALREVQMQERRERERARRERMKRYVERDRVKKEEAKRRKEEEEKKREDSMEVDEDNKGMDVEMKEPIEELEKTRRSEQDGSTSILLDDSLLQQDISNPWTSVASKNTSIPSPPNPADIPLPSTPPLPSSSNLPHPPSPPIPEPEPEPDHLPLPTLLALADTDIITEMRERIARLLYLFHLRGAAHLVLGAYGTGVFQNDVAAVAGIFYDFLVAPGARFRGVFESVVFAILGGETIGVFRRVFGDAVVDGDDGCGQEADSEEEGEVVEEGQDGKDGDGKDGDGKDGDGKSEDDEMADSAKVSMKNDEAHMKEDLKKDIKVPKGLVKKSQPLPSGSRQSTLLSYFSEKNLKAGPKKRLGKSSNKLAPEAEAEATDPTKAKPKVDPELIDKNPESQPTTTSIPSLPEKEAKVGKKVYPRPAKARAKAKAKVDVDPEPEPEPEPEPQPKAKASTNQQSTLTDPFNSPANSEDKTHFPPAAPI